jgi:hypothetical protein
MQFFSKLKKSFYKTVCSLRIVPKNRNYTQKGAAF